MGQHIKSILLAVNQPRNEHPIPHNLMSPGNNAYSMMVPSKYFKIRGHHPKYHLGHYQCSDGHSESRVHKGIRGNGIHSERIDLVQLGSAVDSKNSGSDQAANMHIDPPAVFLEVPGRHYAYRCESGPGHHKF